MATPPWIIKLTFPCATSQIKSPVGTVLLHLMRANISSPAPQIAVSFHLKPFPFLFFTTRSNLCHPLGFTSYQFLKNGFELYFTFSRAMEARRSMEVQYMDNSTRRSKSPSLPSPPCTWLKARWLTLLTTTCATPSSPCCAAACHLELLPSSTPSQWVWLISVYVVYRPVHSHG